MRLRSTLPPPTRPRVALSYSPEILNATQPGGDRPSRVCLRCKRQLFNHRRSRACRPHANHRARSRPRSSNNGCPHGRRLASPTPTSAYRPGLLRAEVRREGRRARSRAIRRRAHAHVPRPACFCRRRRRPSSFSSSTTTHILLLWFFKTRRKKREKTNSRARGASEGTTKTKGEGSPRRRGRRGRRRRQRAQPSEREGKRA